MSLTHRTRQLLGFENHSGRTSDRYEPLGKVIKGYAITGRMAGKALRLGMGSKNYNNSIINKSSMFHPKIALNFRAVAGPLLAVQRGQGRFLANDRFVNDWGGMVF
ncbi:hypothetical protein [Paenibacillus aestuarii]|uniref:Uncharacterized protein n=1 Tax=Paenibacillus aestuarii TaxID=516965 RepID=A0ABW0KGZ8_9BACL|nr:hypothetical protein [Paenibacillus aestuarii]